ncbi:MAG: DUF1631 family protein, partial [Gammaproteobacteria bacterium]
MRHDKLSPMHFAYSESIKRLHDCRDMAMANLMRSLQGMLDKVDDSLFDLAEKSESNTVQSTYFDAMREVRLRRQSMEDAFRRRFLESYSRNAQGDSKEGTHNISGEAVTSDLV